MTRESDPRAHARSLAGNPRPGAREAGERAYRVDETRALHAISEASRSPVDRIVSSRSARDLTIPQGSARLDRAIYAGPKAPMVRADRGPLTPRPDAPPDAQALREAYRAGIAQGLHTAPEQALRTIAARGARLDATRQGSRHPMRDAAPVSDPREGAISAIIAGAYRAGTRDGIQATARKVDAEIRRDFALSHVGPDTSGALNARNHMRIRGDNGRNVNRTREAISRADSLASHCTAYQSARVDVSQARERSSGAMRRTLRARLHRAEIAAKNGDYRSALDILKGFGEVKR